MSSLYNRGRHKLFDRIYPAIDGVNFREYLSCKVCQLEQRSPDLSCDVLALTGRQVMNQGITSNIVRINSGP